MKIATTKAAAAAIRRHFKELDREIDRQRRADARKGA